MANLDAAVIIAPSISGYTARMLSKWHPSTKLVGMSPSISAVRKMMLYWGVTPFQAKRAESTDTLIENSIDILKENGIVKAGDIAVVTAGVVDYAHSEDFLNYVIRNDVDELPVLAAQSQALFQPPYSCRESPATPLTHSHNRQMSALFRPNIRNTLL